MGVVLLENSIDNIFSMKIHISDRGSNLIGSYL